MGKINKSILIIFLSLLINSCSTSPYNVGKDDAQVVLNTDIGVIIDVVPVKIKGNPSEVGAVIIVGGNIDHLTRVMTTTIALETSKGNLSLALALGIILLLIVLIINLILISLKTRAKRRMYF